MIPLGAVVPNDKLGLGSTTSVLSRVLIDRYFDATVDVFALDAEHGTLEHAQTIATLPPGFSGKPWAADIHLTPVGRFLYTSGRRSSTLTAFRVAADSGQLSLIGQVPTEAQPRDFAASPDGHWMYAVGLNPNWVEAITLP